MMQDISNGKTAALLSVEKAVVKVKNQNRAIATMRSDDPVMKYAYALLCEMKQNAVLAEMILVFASFSDDRSQTS